MTYCLATRLARTGCFLVLAVLAYAYDSNVEGTSASAFTSDSTLAGRKLMQGADVFRGGVGLDGGLGGLPAPAVEAVAGAAGGNGGAGGGGFAGGNGAACAGGPQRPVCNCEFGECIYGNECAKCVSRLPSASTATLRGKKCAKPFATNSPTSCRFGFLSGVQIGKTENPLTTSTCIDATRDVVTLYVPRQPFDFFGVTVKKYLYDSISLAGAPLLPTAGIPSKYNYIKKIDGIDYNALVFTGTSAILSKVKGKAIALNGIVNVAGNFDLCFAATVEVRKRNPSWSIPE